MTDIKQLMKDKYPEFEDMQLVKSIRKEERQKLINEIKPLLKDMKQRLDRVISDLDAVSD